MRIIAETSGQFTHYYITDDAVLENSAKNREYIGLSKAADEWEIEYLKREGTVLIKGYRPWWSDNEWVPEFWTKAENEEKTIQRMAEWYLNEMVQYRNGIRATWNN